MSGQACWRSDISLEDVKALRHKRALLSSAKMLMEALTPANHRLMTELDLYCEELSAEIDTYLSPVPATDRFAEGDGMWSSKTVGEEEQ